MNGWIIHAGLPRRVLHPSHPPTPPIPLAELLAREELGLRRIAGPDQADLLWVHTSEMADPYPYLLGGELLLSAGCCSPIRTPMRPGWWRRGGGAGLRVAPVHDTVPRALIEACDRYGLPLVEVPPQTPFTTIARAVWRLMAEARHRELRRVTRAQQALATAAARPTRCRPSCISWPYSWRAGPRCWQRTARSCTGRPTAGPRVRAALDQLSRVVSPVTRAPLLGDRHPGRHPSRRVRAGRRPGPGPGPDSPSARGRRPHGGGDRRRPALLLAAPHQGADAADRSAALVRLLLGATPRTSPRS
ncbi:PucR family transcriptional regulator ligand-binding domain-containing protein [Streptomyces sp. M10(2022)]